MKTPNLKYILLICGDWGLGIGDGDWGLGIGDWPQSPIPNPQDYKHFLFYILFILFLFKINFNILNLFRNFIIL